MTAHGPKTERACAVIDRAYKDSTLTPVSENSRWFLVSTHDYSDLYACTVHLRTLSTENDNFP